MKRKIVLSLVMAVMLQMVGCATNTKTPVHAPVIEAPKPVVKPEIVSPEKQNNTPSLPQAVPQSKVVAPVGNAVASLLVQARAQYQAKNYPAAIATAERGLRIDRRSPELYLLLAQSYVKLVNIPLAQQFVQQGIRYSQAGTEVAQSLIKVRDSLPH